MLLVTNRVRSKASSSLSVVEIKQSTQPLAAANGLTRTGINTQIIHGDQAPDLALAFAERGPGSPEFPAGAGCVVARVGHDHGGGGRCWSVEAPEFRSSPPGRFWQFFRHRPTPAPRPSAPANSLVPHQALIREGGRCRMRPDPSRRESKPSPAANPIAPPTRLATITLTDGGSLRRASMWMPLVTATTPTRTRIARN